MRMLLMDLEVHDTIAFCLEFDPYTTGHLESSPWSLHKKINRSSGHLRMQRPSLRKTAISCTVPSTAMKVAVPSSIIPRTKLAQKPGTVRHCRIPI